MLATWDALESRCGGVFCINIWHDHFLNSGSLITYSGEAEALIVNFLVSILFDKYPGWSLNAAQDSI